MSDPSQIGEAFVRIRPRANPGEFQRETEQAIGPAAKNVGESLSKDIAQTLTAGAFVAFSASVVRSASEAEQAVGGTAAVFKDARGEIDAFAEGSAESLGLTEQATRQFSSQIGSALKGYKFSIQEAADTSQALITKGADLTALFGGSVPEAVSALSATLRGEYDPVERYGISLTAAAVAAKAVELGLATSTSTVDGHAKAVATLAIIEEQTADATGQFGREINTAGGQMAVATAKLGDARDELGSQFLPVATKAAGVVSALATGFGALPGPIQAAVAGIVGLVALSGPLGKVKGSIDGVVESFKEGGDEGSGPLGKVKGSIDGVVESFKEGGDEAVAFRSKLSTLAKTGVIVAGIAAITGGIEALKDATADQQTAFESSLPDVSDVQGYSDAVNLAVARQNELSDQLNEFVDGDGGAGELIDGLAKSWNFFTSSVTGNVSEVGAAKAEYDALSASLPAATLKAEELNSAVNTLGERLGISGVAAAGLVDDFAGLDVSQVPMDKLVDVLGRFQRGEIDAQTAAEQLGVSVSSAGDKAADAAKKLDELRGGLFDLVDAAHAYEDAAIGVADAERNQARSQQSITDAQRSYQASLESISDAQDSYQDATRGVADAEQRRTDSLRTVADATRAVEEAQRRLTEALNGPSESDNLDIESAQIRIEQMRRRLAEGEFADPLDRRQAEIDLRRAEIALAERKAEVDARAGEAAVGLQDASLRLADAQRSADDAARAVTDAQESQRDAATAIADAQYNAERAYEAITVAQLNAEKASRDVERAKYDQLKASEELAAKIGEEQVAFAGANGEVSKLVDYYRNLIALRPELASAIQPLLNLLTLAATPAPSTPITGSPVDPGFTGGGGGTGGTTGGPPRTGGTPGTGTGPSTPGAYYRPPGIYDGVYWPGGIVYPAAGGNAAPTGDGISFTQHNYGVDIAEATRLGAQHLDLIRGI